jgi:hypothetical protein
MMLPCATDASQGSMMRNRTKAFIIILYFI